MGFRYRDGHRRSLVLPSNSKNKSDTEWFYTEPASTQPGQVSLTTKTEMIDVQYGNRTWSDTTFNAGFPSDMAYLQNLRESIAKARFPDVRNTELNGRTMLELTVHLGADGTQTWWVDPVTYLPVRTLTRQAAMTLQIDFRFLPPAPVNIAQLKVSILAGFTRTPTQKLP